MVLLLEWITRLGDCNIQLLLDGVLISEVGPTPDARMLELSGPASNTFNNNLIINQYPTDHVIAGKLYRPLNSGYINTDLSFNLLSENADIITDSKGGIVAILNNFTKCRYWLHRINIWWFN